jgi:hypothetical protein
MGEALRPRSNPGSRRDDLDPTSQTRIFFLMMMVTLIFAAQMAAQTGAFAGLR